MSDSIFLSREELRAVTGYRQKSRQIAWLRENGWRAHVNGAGEICVDRAFYLKKMVGETTEKPAKIEPNWSALAKA